LKRIGLAWLPRVHPWARPQVPPIGVEVVPAGVSNAAEVEHAIEKFAHSPNGGLIVLPSPIASIHSNLIIGLAARHRVPAVYPFRFYASDGGLISFGINSADLFRRAASYVDRILIIRGEKAADLPVQAPTKFELVIKPRLPRRSASKCHRCCSRVPTR
jgi:putative tryptophan/tyrosine transport system substrate-binding protein